MPPHLASFKFESLPRRHALPPHAACARFLCVAASTPLYIFAPMTNIVSGNMAEVTDDRASAPRLTKKQLVVMDTKLGEKYSLDVFEHADKHHARALSELRLYERLHGAGSAAPSMILAADEARRAYGIGAGRAPSVRSTREKSRK